MPVYHFHVHGDVSGTSPDLTATELPNATSAEREAVRLAGGVIADNALSDCYGEKWHLEVTDHSGTPLFHLDFAIKAVSAAPIPHSAVTSIIY